jgi:hypothetical protein
VKGGLFARILDPRLETTTVYGFGRSVLAREIMTRFLRVISHARHQYVLGTYWKGIIVVEIA